MELCYERLNVNKKVVACRFNRIYILMTDDATHCHGMCEGFIKGHD